jgi:hypothetical protein
MVTHDLDWGLVPDYIRRDVEQFTADNHMEPISDPIEAFTRWLAWNGIIGYSSQIRDVLAELISADSFYLVTTDQQRAAWLAELLRTEVTL